MRRSVLDHPADVGGAAEIAGEEMHVARLAAELACQRLGGVAALVVVDADAAALSGIGSGRARRRSRSIHRSPGRPCRPGRESAGFRFRSLSQVLMRSGSTTIGRRRTFPGRRLGPATGLAVNVDEGTAMSLLLALLIGVVAGLRAMTAPAAVSWGAWLGLAASRRTAGQLHGSLAGRRRSSRWPRWPSSSPTSCPRRRAARCRCSSAPGWSPAR